VFYTSFSSHPFFFFPSNAHRSLRSPCLPLTNTSVSFSVRRLLFSRVPFWHRTSHQTHSFSYIYRNHQPTNTKKGFLIMAELNQRMSNLGMSDSIHAADGVPSSGASNHSSGSGGRGTAASAYIPPHLRGAARSNAGPAPVMVPPVQNGTANGVQSSRWSSGYVINISISFPCFLGVANMILFPVYLVIPTFILSFLTLHASNLMLGDIVLILNSVQLPKSRLALLLMAMVGLMPLLSLLVLRVVLGMLLLLALNAPLIPTHMATRVAVAIVAVPEMAVGLMANISPDLLILVPSVSSLASPMILPNKPLVSISRSMTISRSRLLAMMFPNPSSGSLVRLWILICCPILSLHTIRALPPFKSIRSLSLWAAEI